MYRHDVLKSRTNRQHLLHMTGALALGAVLLTSCGDDTPSHTVVVQEGQTLHDIGVEECGPAFTPLDVVARFNRIRKFNDLPEDATVTAGQAIKVPDSLCYDTGEKRH